jgi:thiol-disulfide isomerase/thioredoxin
VTARTRWTIAILIVVAALAAGLVAHLHDDRDGSGANAVQSGGPKAAREHGDADTPAALAGPRQRANLPPCPDFPGPGPAAVRGVTVECAADGSAVDVARAVAGRRVVLNLWAYWCAPCAAELPAMAEYQRKAGPGVLVITVHQDENEAAALLRLAELGVRLPTLQDGRRLIPAALAIPNVVPATLVLRPDGSVAQALLRDFATADEIAAAIKSDG